MSTSEITHQTASTPSTHVNENKKPIVDVVNLSKTFKPQIKAVDGISFQVYEGEIFGFLGPNGAGKQLQSAC